MQQGTETPEEGNTIVPEVISAEQQSNESEAEGISSLNIF